MCENAYKPVALNADGLMQDWSISIANALDTANLHKAIDINFLSIALPIPFGECRSICHDIYYSSISFVQVGPVY